MDYTKLTKKQLIEKIIADEEVVENAEFYKQEFEAAKKLREDIIESEYRLKKELKDCQQKDSVEVNRLKAEIASKEKDMQALNGVLNDTRKRFNDLALIFDQYIQALEDQYSLQQLFLRNTKNTIELLKIKVNKFNEGEKEE